MMFSVPSESSNYLTRASGWGIIRVINKILTNGGGIK